MVPVPGRVEENLFCQFGKFSFVFSVESPSCWMEPFLSKDIEEYFIIKNSCSEIVENLTPLPILHEILCFPDGRCHESGRHRTH